ncbi:MAG: tetratricopeptide repeat protein [Acidobacteriota bacterium]|nr:tetratricopeptide repeat protein [Acidobacteriota bacterium]MDH3786467.1 tetratricopeptide repeat protein [Acidobacteriota bacterium]
MRRPLTAPAAILCLPLLAGVLCAEPVESGSKNQRPILSAASEQRAEAAIEWRATLVEANLALAGGAHDRAEGLLVKLLARPDAAHPSGLLRARASDELADLYRITDRPALAIPHYRNSIESLSRLLGPDQPRVAVSLHNLGVCQGRAGDRAGARKSLDAALEVWRRNDGEQSENYANTVRALQRFVGDD